MNCRKCGAKQITRRSAGVFSCAHCGVQPGPFHLDRFANVTRPPLEPELSSVGPLREVAPRQPRLLAGSAAKKEHTKMPPYDAKCWQKALKELGMLPITNENIARLKARYTKLLRGEF